MPTSSLIDLARKVLADDGGVIGFVLANANRCGRAISEGGRTISKREGEFCSAKAASASVVGGAMAADGSERVVFGQQLHYDFTKSHPW